MGKSGVNSNADKLSLWVETNQYCHTVNGFKQVHVAYLAVKPSYYIHKSGHLCTMPEAF